MLREINSDFVHCVWGGFFHNKESKVIKGAWLGNSVFTVVVFLFVSSYFQKIRHIYFKLNQMQIILGLSVLRLFILFSSYISVNNCVVILQVINS